jgi:hypothetical protein
MIEHKRLLDEYVSKGYDDIMNHLIYYCNKTYPTLQRTDLDDLFNQSFLDCSESLLQATEDYVVKNIGDYFYASLRHKAIKMSKEIAKKVKVDTSTNKSVCDSDGNYYCELDIEDTSSKDLEEALINEERYLADKDLYDKVIAFVLANHTKDEVEAFKFRALSNLTYKEMKSYSGLSESGIRKRYLKVHKNIINNFKRDNIYEILRRFESKDVRFS